MQRSNREVWFVRHGESVANAGGRTQEAGSYSLSERGFRQAEQLASVLDARPELIIHSTYLRARQTAQPFMAKMPHVPVEEWPVHEVQYLDPAHCVGTTQDERRLLARDYWVKCDPNYAAPGAESFVLFIGRVREALDALASRHEKHTVVFAHGHVMRAVAWLLLFKPSALDVAAMRHFRNFMEGYPVPNCSVQELFFHACGRESIASLWVPDGVEREPVENMDHGIFGVPPAF